MRFGIRAWAWGVAALVLGACGSEEKARDATGSDTSTPDVAADVEVDTAVGADGSGAPDAAPPIVRVDDGLACDSDEGCKSGRCLSPEEGFPGGFCSKEDCESRRDCSGAGRACLRNEFNGNLCVQLCATDADCRTGYECLGPAGQGGYCFPAFADAALTPTCASTQVAANDVRAGQFGGARRLNRHAIEFQVPDGTKSFFVVAWDPRKPPAEQPSNPFGFPPTELIPDRLLGPDGIEQDMGDYANYNYTPQQLGRVSPILFPGGPQFEGLVKPGTYTLEFGFSGGESEDVCFVVYTEGDGLGRGDEQLVVDLNLYFVGVEGVTSENAEANTNFQEMLETFDSLYTRLGIRLGEVRYYDVEGDVRDRFTVIREQTEVFELVKLSRQPGSTRERLLSANVFFVRGFSNQLLGVLGVSTGIPGVPGIHGREGTGLVFGAEFLGRSGQQNGNELVGQVLAHELGHFLGLFHTTEQQGGGRDQLEDTAVCPAETMGDRGRLNRCPDYANLMFPIAAPRNFIEVSDGQVMIMRANPLTRRADAP